MTCSATVAEHARLAEWYEAAFGSPEEVAPGAAAFSFRYADRAIRGRPPGWETEVTDSSDEAGDRRTVRYRDGATGLEVTCDVRRFRDFAAVEWVLHFRNTGDAETPILADIQPLDAAFALPRGQPCRVHHARGSECRSDDFAPLVTSLGPSRLDPQAGWIGEGNPLVVQTHGGRSSNGALPFFNVEMNEAAGVIGAIGWTGDWAARFWRGEGGEVHVQAGMQRTHFKLLPGEEVRSPRILLLFWEGDALRGHALLRQLILAQYAPRRDGRTARAPISFAVWGQNRAERQLGKVRWFTENAVPIDNFWIDAGWHGDAPYQDNANVFNSDWWRHVGNWWPNATAYPEGLGPIGDAVRAAGMDFTLWLEPERVFAGTEFTKKHLDWLLGPMGDNYLLNLGNHEACEAVTDLVSAIIRDARLTVYRQDFNTDPAPFWAAADAPDRVGISEIRHIEGLYAFWDALLARHPGLLIDNCSSGGRRIDLETLSRSIPLWRSDFPCFPSFDPIGVQGETHGLSLWAPLHTGCCDRPDTYAFRSALGPGIVFTTPPNESGVPEGCLTPWQAFDADWLRSAVREERAVQAYFAGDFYPLLSHTLADDAWAAWQFDRPDLGEGMVLAFRRPRSPFPLMEAPLRGLDPDAVYELTDAGEDGTQRASGRELTTTGLSIRIDDKPGSRLVLYRRVGEE
jgi:alpha-galactosidase